MELALYAYGWSVIALWIMAGISYATPNSTTKEGDQRYWARVIFVAPVWPLTLLYQFSKLIKSLWKTAEFGGKK